MKIAELFVQLGIRGTEKTVGALSSVRKTFSDITSTSLETKAAIVGVMYGLERLMSQSAKTGTQITQFNNLTGLSGDKLQRWQYLALQAGVSADTMTADIQAVQQAMAKLYLGQGAPAGMNALINTLKDSFDPRRIRDTFYMMDKIREYLQKTKDIPDIANQVAKTFGPSDQTIQAMRASNVELEKVNRSRLYTARESKRLNEVDIGFVNLADKFQHSTGKLVSQFGPSMLKDINRVTDSILRLAEAFGKLNTSLHLIQGMSRIFAGWAGILDLVTDTTKTISAGKARSLVPDTDTLKIFAQSLVGAGPAVGAGAKNVTNNVTVNAPITGVKDTDDAGKHLGRHINNAFRNIQKGGE